MFNNANTSTTSIKCVNCFKYKTFWSKLALLIPASTENCPDFVCLMKMFFYFPASGDNKSGGVDEKAEYMNKFVRA